MKASDDAVLLPAIRRLRRGELALRCGLSAREAIDSTDPTAVLTGARTVGSGGAALPSRHAPAPRPLSAAHGPGPLPKLLRGHAPPVGGQVSRPAPLSLQLRRRRSRGRVTVFLRVRGRLRRRGRAECSARFPRGPGGAGGRPALRHRRRRRARLRASRRLSHQAGRPPAPRPARPRPPTAVPCVSRRRTSFIVFSGLEGTYAVPLTGPAIYSTWGTRPTARRRRWFCAEAEAWLPRRRGSPPATATKEIAVSESTQDRPDEAADKASKPGEQDTDTVAGLPDKEPESKDAEQSKQDQ